MELCLTQCNTAAHLNCRHKASLARGRDPTGGQQTRRTSSQEKSDDSLIATSLILLIKVTRQDWNECRDLLTQILQQWIVDMLEEIYLHLTYIT